MSPKFYYSSKHYLLWILVFGVKLFVKIFHIISKLADICCDCLIGQYSENISDNFDIQILRYFGLLDFMFEITKSRHYSSNIKECMDNQKFVFTVINKAPRFSAQNHCIHHFINILYVNVLNMYTTFCSVKRPITI